MKSIKLTNGTEAIVDEDSYEMLSRFKWYGTLGYAIASFYDPTTKKTRNIYMHRMVMGMVRGDGKQVDHINGNRLDNRLQNLRICTDGENKRNIGIRSSNTSGFKCVSWSKQHKKWCSYINVNKRKKHLGLFDSPEEAHKAYMEAARVIHGEFANFG